MKNIKKLLVILPLVLVMLLTAVPVMAYTFDASQIGNVQIALEEGWKVGLKIDKNLLSLDYLTQPEAIFPIWLAEQSYVNDKNLDLGTYTAGPITMMNNGLPVDWVKANLDAISPMNLAQKWLADSKYAGDYDIRSFNINNVIRAHVTAEVPAAWVDNTFEYYAYAEDGPIVVKAGTEVAEADVNKDNMTAVVNGYKASVIETSTSVGEFEYKMTVVTPIDGVVEAGYELTKEEQAQVTIDDKDKTKGEWNTGSHKIVVKVEVTKAPTTVKGYAVATDVLAWKKGEAISSTHYEQLVNLNGKTVIQAGCATGGCTYIPVVVKVGEEDLGCLVPVTFQGFLIVVEKQNVPVKITHHYIVDGTEQFTEETEQKIGKVYDLTASWVNENSGWVLPKAGLVLDPTQTKVVAIDDNQEFTMGETFLNHWKVDLYYKAAEAKADDKDNVDAAPAPVAKAPAANTTAPAANVQSAAQLPNTAVALPATGAADNVLLVLSSAALVVLGLFIKK